jgi:hypothetical protein
MEFHRFDWIERWSSIAWGGFDGTPSPGGRGPVKADGFPSLPAKTMEFHHVLDRSRKAFPQVD